MKYREANEGKRNGYLMKEEMKTNENKWKKAIINNRININNIIIIWKAS